jgi:putative ABC transport system substrate-binding protein
MLDSKLKARDLVIKLISIIVASGALTTVQPAVADEGRKLPTVGLAIPVDQATDAAFQKAFRDGLREAGYVDGENVMLIVRYANGEPKKLRENIQELIALKVDVLMGDARL